MPTDRVKLTNLVRDPEFASKRTSVAKMLHILSAVYAADPKGFDKLLIIQHRRRVYFARNPQVIERSGTDPAPRKIPGSPFWVLTKLSAEAKRQLLEGVLKRLGYEGADIAKAVGSLQEAPSKGAKDWSKSKTLDTLSARESEILLRLVAAGTELMIVAGYAVRYYVPRRAKDLDVLLRASKENIQKAWEAIAPLLSISNAQFSGPLLNGDSVEIDGVEFLPDYSGRSYADLRTQAQSLTYRDHGLLVIGLKDLLAIKREKTKVKDKKDARALQQLQSMSTVVD